MIAVLRIALRHARRHPAQPLLAVLAVALGVAVVVGVDLANVSATKAFDRTVLSLTGRATHRVVGGPAGIDEAAYAALVRAGFDELAPAVDGLARELVDGERRRPLRVAGIDPFAEAPLRPWFGWTVGGRIEVGDLLTVPGAVLVSTRTAAALGVGPGDRFRVQSRGVDADLEVVGVLDPDDPVVARGLDDVLIADIATAQEVLGERGRIDRIDAILDADRHTALAAALPQGTRIETAAEGRGVLERLTRAFRLNLRALGLLALVVGAFLVHNAMQLIVVQRRPLIGLLRALGADRRQVFTAVVIEAGAIGIVGSALGLAFGTLLARGLLGVVGRTIGEMYATVAVHDVAVDPASLAAGAALGIGASLVAALAPALEATRVPPRAAMLRTDLEGRARGFARRLVPVGVGLTLFGLFAADHLGAGILPAYLAVFAFLLGMALIAPTATELALRLVGRPLRATFGTTGAHAARSAAAGLSRTAVAVAALALAVSATVGLGAMIGSFRATVVDWLDATLSADVYVTVPASMSDRTEVRMAPDTLAAIRALDGVAATSTYRRVEVEAHDGIAIELAAIAPGPDTAATFTWVDGSPAAARAVLEADDGVLVSEPLARRRGLERGDPLHLVDGSGRDVALPVRGVFRDYASERGYAILSRARYVGLFADDAVTSVALWAAPGHAPADLAATVVAAADDAGQEVVARADDALRAASLDVFDRTFAVTDVLRVLCTVVAFLGVLGALTALQLERRREAAVLRAVGATPGQVARGVVLQNLLLGLCAGIWAVPTGVGLAWLLVDVVNRRSFGWTLMNFEVSPWIVAEAIGMAWVAALLASIWPARRLARLAVASNLREE